MYLSLRIFEAIDLKYFLYFSLVAMQGKEKIKLCYLKNNLIHANNLPSLEKMTVSKNS